MVQIGLISTGVGTNPKHSQTSASNQLQNSHSSQLIRWCRVGITSWVGTNAHNSQTSASNELQSSRTSSSQQVRWFRVVLTSWDGTNAAMPIMVEHLAQISYRALVAHNRSAGREWSYLVELELINTNSQTSGSNEPHNCSHPQLACWCSGHLVELESFPKTGQTSASNYLQNSLNSQAARWYRMVISSCVGTDQRHSRTSSSNEPHNFTDSQPVLWCRVLI